jgi:hypothetical protein
VVAIAWIPGFSSEEMIAAALFAAAAASLRIFTDRCTVLGRLFGKLGSLLFQVVLPLCAT